MIAAAGDRATLLGVAGGADGLSARDPRRSARGCDPHDP